MDRITVVIADDELLAREGLAMCLQEIDTVELVASCRNGLEALDAISEHNPDLVLLDIEMPYVSGVELVNALKARLQTHTEVIYVTALNQFAVDAYQQGIKDYILKPISVERVRKSIEGFIHRRAMREAGQSLAQFDQLVRQRTGKTFAGMLEQLQQDTDRSLATLNPYLSLKNGSQWLRVKVDEINWIEAAGDYICVHTDNAAHIARHTLSGIEANLDHQRFCRVSRSAIINLEQLTRLTPNSNGEYHAMLRCGEEVKVSRNYKGRLKELREEN
ncbi:LytTR family DNA-binding domain-containing protein [Bowmanella sp. Y26]|uniref:LytR/AlgR family response regulator transcription factor n=1 Tax=Bowmanella yangjiangensis TaxID=2811230 RepID=UPI001BDD9837|nr:LytTR family DNA-binding domain-containing protein [Bowmanella yangjiangensis]MBT1064634.1 LytTR family DNA-binding domain-containing protein [Bowmanella yangjiangensis]